MSSTQKPLIVSIKSPGFGDAEVHVVSADGRDAISVLFDLDLLVTCPQDLDHKEVLKSGLTVTFHKDDKLVREIHGMAASIREIVTADTSQRNYRIHMVPRMWKGTLNERIDIYMDMTVPEIVQKKLEENALKLGDDFVFKLQQTYPKREFVVQYRESDVAFISRLTEQLGISFFFEHTTGRDVVIFSDDNGAFQPIAEGDDRVGLRTAVGDFGVQTLESRTVQTPGKYIVRDYNYRTPTVDLTGDKEVQQGSGGVIVEYGAHFKTPEEGKWVAGVRAQEIEAQRFVHDGTGTDARFRAGSTFTLEGHPRGELELLLTEVTHRVRQAAMGAGAGSEASTYEVTFSAIAQKTTYRPPRRTPKPKVHGVLTGIIDTAAKGEYAELDSEGRYKVKFLYDTAETPDALASRPVRMAQPHAGAGYGMHFPLRQGVEVVLTCVDGDPDRPIIQSTVPNPQTPSPVTKGNNARNVIRTGGGNEINIDDTEGQHRIKMTTPHQGTVFQLGSPNFNEDGAALATAGAITTTAEGITSAISGVSAAIDACTTHLSADIITTASWTNIDFSKAAKAVIGAAKACVGVANNIQNVRKTMRDNDAAEATAKATAAADALAAAKMKKTKEGLKEHLPPDSDAAKAQAAVELAQTALLTAEQAFYAASERKKSLEGEKDELEARWASDAEIEKKQREIDNALKGLEKAAIDQGRAGKALKSAEKKRNEAFLQAKDLSFVEGVAIAGATQGVLEAKRDAATATNEKTAFEEGLKSDFLAQATQAVNSMDAALGAAEAVSELWSTIMKVKQLGQKAAAIATTEAMALTGKRIANGALYAEFTAGTPITPFNIMDSGMTSAVVSNAATVIGSVKSTTITGTKIGVGALKELVMSSGQYTELFAVKNAALTSRNQVDVYSMKKLRLVAHSDKHHEPAGSPQLFVGAAKDIEINSETENIRCLAKKSFVVVAETEGFKVKAKTGAYAQAKELKAAGQAFGVISDDKEAFFGSVTTGDLPSATEAVKANGVTITKDGITSKSGDSRLSLSKKGTLTLQGTKAMEVKVEGNNMTVSDSKILLG